MFEWTPLRDKFRIFAWAVVALLACIAIDLIAIKPYQNWQHRQAHPESNCPSGTSPSPDRRYVVYSESCFYSPDGTVVAIYAEGEPEGYGTYQTTNAILNVKSGGPVYVTWKTNRDLLVICRHCRERDAWFVKRQFRDIAIEYRFER